MVFIWDTKICFLQQFNIRRVKIIEYHTQCPFVDFFHFVSTVVQPNTPDCITIRKFESTKVLYNLILTSSFKNFETLLRHGYDLMHGNRRLISVKKSSLSSMCRPSILTHLLGVSSFPNTFTVKDATFVPDDITMDWNLDVFVRMKFELNHCIAVSVQCTSWFRKTSGSPCRIPKVLSSAKLYVTPRSLML